VHQQQQQQPIYVKITADEAKQLMDEAEGFILLDVRTEVEYQESHIEGAILIPDYELAERAPTEVPDKHGIIIIYCRSGRRSANSAHVLLDMGYTHVYDLGGILDWPYTMVSGN